MPDWFEILAITPAQWCQAYYVLIAGALLAAATLPRELKRLLLEYGPRTSEVQQQPEKPRESSLDRGGIGTSARELILRGRVPHSWFIYFYITSAASSISWAIQYCINGGILHYVAASQFAAASTFSMTMHQVLLAWGLMAIQGVRRLLEDLFVMKASKSTMLPIHWLFGVSFYFCMGITVWIEGSAAILNERPSLRTLFHLTTKEFLLVLLFALASFGQNWCHKHLAGLKKYSLPESGPFRYIVCPHYTCECLIYLSLTLLAAPPGRMWNQTLLCGLGLVATNLGITACGTRRWYGEKFGRERLGGRWAMIPFVL